MKRLLALLLCLVIGLCGCTQEGTEDSSLVQDDSKMEESSVVEESLKKEESFAVEESSKAEESSGGEESSVAEESSTPEESAPEVAPYLTESAPGTWFNAYLEIIEYLSQTHGISFEGLYIAKLLDFNADGQQELLCVYTTDDHWSEELVYGYDGEKATLLWNQYAGSSNAGAPLTTILEYEGISYLKYKNGSSDRIYGFDGEIFTLLDTIAYPDEVKQAKYNAYTVAYSVSTYQQFIDNGPYTLQDTLDTLNSLREQCGIVVEEEPFNVEKMLATYRQIIADLEAVHGKTTDGTDGLCMVKLIDLNKDGIDELFCSWATFPGASYQNEIYTWQNGEAVQILSERGLNPKGDVDPRIWWYEGTDAVYIVYGNNANFEYKTLVDGEMVTVATCFFEDYTLNGKTCTREEFDMFFSEMEYSCFWYCESMEHVREYKFHGTGDVPETWHVVSVEEF